MMQCKYLPSSIGADTAENKPASAKQAVNYYCHITGTCASAATCGRRRGCSSSCDTQASSASSAGRSCPAEARLPRASRQILNGPLPAVSKPILQPTIYCSQLPLLSKFELSESHISVVSTPIDAKPSSVSGRMGPALCWSHPHAPSM